MRRASVAIITASALFAAGVAGPATAKTTVKKTSVTAKKRAAAGDCVLVHANIKLLGNPIEICL